MVVKKKKTRLLRAGAVAPSSTDSPQESVEVVEDTEAEATDISPEVGVGGRANRVRAKKTIKKTSKPSKPKQVASSDSDDEDSEFDLLETDTNIINARQFLSKVLAGHDENSVNRYWMNKNKLLVATVDCQKLSITKVEIEPTEHGQVLAQTIWDEIEGEGLDPATIDVTEDGWHFQFDSGYEEEEQ